MSELAVDPLVMQATCSCAGNVVMACGHDVSWEVGDIRFFIKSCMVEFTRHVAYNFTGHGQPTVAEIRVLFRTYVLDLCAKYGVEVTDLPLPHGM